MKLCTCVRKFTKFKIRFFDNARLFNTLRIESCVIWKGKGFIFAIGKFSSLVVNRCFVEWQGNEILFDFWIPIGFIWIETWYSDPDQGRIRIGFFLESLTRIRNLIFISAIDYLCLPIIESYSLIYKIKNHNIYLNINTRI